MISAAHDSAAGTVFPAELTERRQWLCWRFVNKPGQKKPSKMPYYASGMLRGGKQGSPDDRAKLTDYSTALAAVESGRFDGLGFAFLPDDGLIGIDLDACHESDERSDYAAELIQRCASYTELSPSGNGYHIIVKGHTKTFKSNDVGIEVFCGSQFFTMTGNAVDGCEGILSTISDELLGELRRKVKGDDDAGAGDTTAPLPLPVPRPNAGVSSDAMRYCMHALKSAVERVSGCTEGGRNDALNLEAYGLGQLLHHGIITETTVAAELAAAAARCGLPKGEAEATIRSGLRGGQQNPRAIPERERPAPAPRYSQPAPTPAPAAYPSTFEVDDETGEIMAPQAANDNAPLALCSEDDLASGHLARMDGNTLWCEKWGTWLQWGRTRWQRDETLAVLDEVRHSMRIAARQVMASPDIKPDAQVRLAEKLCSHRVISNVEKLARLSRDVATHPDEWDADTMVLNTPGGVVDLRTGIMRPHVRGDRMTKLTSVAPGGDCPTWHDFLHTATQGNGELIGFLRRMCGYALTGEIREHALFFVYGTGGNGKGTFLNTITHIMGDYQRVAGAETFTESHGDRHTTELARLQGARMVTAQETEEGKRWAEARIKALTGGDPITARFMRQDDFTYIPQFKLVIVGNHKPSFRNVDDAIRRRLHLIPFTFKASPDKIDPRLSEKLKAEASGILAWMIQGCIEWQQTGLRPPEIVKESTDEYLGGEDSLQQWLDDCCDLGMGFTTSKALFKSWSEWAENAGEFVGTMKRLMAKLESRGVSTGQKHRGMRGCNGIQLKQTY